MKTNFREKKRLLFLSALLLFSTPAEAQHSIYERILGFETLLPETRRPLSQGPSLSIQLKSRYDHIFRSSSNEMQLKLARSQLAASVNWRLSKNQAWLFKIKRASETLKANTLDSSWNVNSIRTINQFQVKHYRKLPHLPITLFPYIQIHEESQRVSVNYGLGIQADFHNFTFTLLNESKNWLPFLQEIFVNQTQVELRFPTLANIRQIEGSVSGDFYGINLKFKMRTGKLVSANRHQNEYTFRPTGGVTAFHSSLQKNLNSNWRVNAFYKFERITGDGVMRFRDRKYGNVHLNSFLFSEGRTSLNRVSSKFSFQFALAYQRLSGKANGAIQAWPFDNSAIDFFKAKQSFVGDGNIDLFRSKLRVPLTLSKKLTLSLSAEYLNVRVNTGAKTWGSALIFATGKFGKYDLNSSHHLMSIALSPKVTLSQNLHCNFDISQWIPLSVGTGLPGKTRGGLFAQAVLALYF